MDGLVHGVPERRACGFVRDDVLIARTRKDVRTPRRDRRNGRGKRLHGARGQNRGTIDHRFPPSAQRVLKRAPHPIECNSPIRPGQADKPLGQIRRDDDEIAPLPGDALQGAGRVAKKPRDPPVWPHAESDITAPEASHDRLLAGEIVGPRDKAGKRALTSVENVSDQRPEASLNDARGPRPSTRQPAGPAHGPMR